LRREVESDNALWQPDALLHARDVATPRSGAHMAPFALPERGILIPKLSQLAFQMQTQRAVNEAAQVRVTYDEALTMLDHPRAEDILKGGEALGVLEEDRGRDEVLYVHQLLQEYFAARQLARAPQAELVQQECVPIVSGPACRPPCTTWPMPTRLPLLPSTGWEETTVLAAQWPAILTVSSPI